MYAHSQGVGVLVSFYRDAQLFRQRPFKSLSGTAAAAIEIATRYLGLFGGDDVLSELVALSPGDIGGVEERFNEDDPASSMFDMLLEKVEKVLVTQFRTWQGTVTTHKRSMTDRSSSIALSHADDFAWSDGALLGHNVRC